MKRRTCHILMATLLVTIRVSVISKSLSPYDTANQQQVDTIPIQDVPEPASDSTQIPTIHGLMGVQYANYEPEGWKCKCFTSYFNP
ncbi:hypothetical protein L6164_013939 [Bauhinia variegata]|uniref:Uncharacterized protein n=1 Tax=Bauhinia variegata TaxID=167791 RepID=A0ACB9NFM1_BAUVA|nr:hypothetical protein L6164_013939 [Bauhinia variegata]